ncbi:hypothetical protein WL02_31090 [Burkholderia ubonensis]|uniref:RND transporter n=1 Tax=Burkholderia ubonensis TaxID=101571 RepID=A0AAW3MUQ3_9BURK|nr:hypothetical protein WJ96_13165 [Burkholderia ubonensis]KVQ49505.1 hypothetical protein WK04_06870 [Burkholderia ubonensis]KVX25321.1 hypothetical protein WL02_31090 [Burkholderia ubonensis]KVZ89032.1 hypothetical protein WL25_23720 [Burkholderia ubonensis]
MSGLAGCASDHVGTQPTIDVPVTWRTSPLLAPGGLDVRWSNGFGSTVLQNLIAQALEQGTDVAAASARLQQANAMLADTRSSLFPQLNAQVSRTGPNASLSNDAYLSSGAYSWLLNGAYDLDVWGGNGATVDAARADAHARRFALDAIKIDVAAAVMSTFVQASAIRARIVIAVRNLDKAKQTEALVAARVSNGYVPPLELVQQRTLVATQVRAVATLRLQETAAELALARLLNVAPAHFAPSIDDFDSLDVPPLAPDLPSTLLARRPDIAAAEARLAAADANIRAARAALLPSASISAALYNPGSSLARIVASPFYALSASLVATIFDGGHLRARRDLAEGQRAELIADYQRAVGTALNEVELALNAMSGADAEIAAQRDARAQARTALAIAEARYRAGGETWLTVLDAQRTLFAEEDLAIQLRQAKMLAEIALFRAMGGGWRNDGAATAGLRD